ncbi:alpha/beta fold hydrolase [Roseateles saccharophilus]|uniref:Proline iminopeptidase n=1 Tax=Roseateles saccharophilus TaxID=304 RepID=A0A4R3UTP5_ROSSA|nr:alpha/beta fold hydrolase [Roseateles saccharophilus]MDG0832660.1 alpha/beta fold hydrolase [Roseateles saccharophilus]TCU95405.1 proline iminopeptidase [Roseateles saccharophilus]
MTSSATPAALFPDTPAFASHALPVPGGHVLSVQEYGRPDGLAAVVLHGGPGSGCSPLLRRVFDPAHWRIVCPDQRGAGASLPRGGTAHNRTGDLLDDLARIRERLGIERWVVVGGSWGAALALAHAAAEPRAVAALLLRASFLARPQDVAAFFGPLSLAQLAAELDAPEPAARERAALVWWRREQELAGTHATEPQGEALAAQVDRLRVQAHYLRHGCWLQSPTLLERCEAVPGVPVHLIHGRDDRVCTPEGAALLQSRLRGATLQWVDGAGHDAADAAMVAATVGALAHYASDGRFADGGGQP